MGTYFRCYKQKGVVRKTLIRKTGGSPYPTFNDFESKLRLVKEYLGDFVVNTKIDNRKGTIRIEQPSVDGKDIFEFLKERKPKRFEKFIGKLDNLYSRTGILPDLLNKGNVLVTNNNDKIKIVDVWPLFFKQRVIDGDISEQSYDENVEKFNLLKLS